MSKLLQLRPNNQRPETPSLGVTENDLNEIKAAVSNLSLFQIFKEMVTNGCKTRTKGSPLP
jgi:hypothetical protein